MLKIIIPVSFIVFLISFFNRDNLGGNLGLLPQLQEAPLQTPLSANPFQATVNKNTYTVEPKFEYEIYGLVVSYNLHDGEFGAHRRWGDHINVADICVVWQDTAFSEHLTELDFWNGEFTCNVKTYSDEAWATFKWNQLSNNHLITDSAVVRDQIGKVAIGDQIKISGWLASYTYPNGGTRGTSTTREDTGNGACETIYVNDFRILSHYTSPWRWLMYGSLGVLAICIIIYFRQPFRVKQ